MSENAASFTAVSLTVNDTTASLAFYRRLGMVIPEESVWPSNDVGHHVASSWPMVSPLNWTASP